jgi:hypothetical protein
MRTNKTDDAARALAHARIFAAATDAADVSTVTAVTTDAEIDQRVAAAVEAAPEASAEEIRALLTGNRTTYRANAETQLRELAREIEQLTERLAAARRSRDRLIRTAAAPADRGGWLSQHAAAERARLRQPTVNDILSKPAGEETPR